MNRDPAPGRSHDAETVQGRTGKIRHEVLCLRETDAEENSIRESDMDSKFVRTDSLRLEARPAPGLPLTSGDPCATKITVERTLRPGS
jgi:hypothetical protein